MAQELRVYAEALSEAAPNGLQPAMPPPDAKAGMDDSGMSMAPTPLVEKSFTVAELMDYCALADTASVVAHQDCDVVYKLVIFYHALSHSFLSVFRRFADTPSFSSRALPSRVVDFRRTPKNWSGVFK